MAEYNDDNEEVCEEEEEECDNEVSIKALEMAKR